MSGSIIGYELFIANMTGELDGVPESELLAKPFEARNVKIVGNDGSTNEN